MSAVMGLIQNEGTYALSSPFTLVVLLDVTADNVEDASLTTMDSSRRSLNIALDLYKVFD